MRSVGAVVRLADHLHRLLLEQVAQSRAEQIVIVHEKDAWRRLGVDWLSQ
jgi:hypothetical protein